MAGEAFRARTRGAARFRRPDIVMGALGAYAALFVLWSLSWSGSESDRTFLSDIAFPPLGVFVAVLAVVAARSEALPSAARRGWLLLALSFATYATADIGWAVFELVLDIAPFPSYVDVLYLWYYPLTLAGLLLLPRIGRTRDESIRIALDAATVLVGGGMIIWHFVLRPTVIDLQPDPLSTILSLAYPVGDLVLLLGVSIVVFRRPDPLIREPLWILGAGLLVFLVADIAFGALSLADAYEPGSWVDATWIVAIAVSGMAARRQVLNTRLAPAAVIGETERQPYTFLPYLAVALGYALLLFVAQDELTTELGELILAAVVLTGLVVLRQVSSLREIVRLQAERVLRRSEARFRSLVQNAADLIAVVDQAGTILYASPSMERRLGLATDGLAGSSFADIVHPDDAPAALELIKTVAGNDRDSRTAEWRIRQSSGTVGYVEAVAANQVRDADVRGIVLTMRDVEERKSFEQQLAHQAFHDPLTNLANRALFGDRVDHALARTGRSGGSLAVLFLDLDDFKRVNDSFGHQAGDQLLLDVAGRLRGCIRPGDTAARLGGDEFAVLVEDPPDVEATLGVAERILSALARPFRVADTDVVVAASIGIATNGHNASRASDLLRNADLAMYAAKSDGKGVARIYEPTMHSAVVDRLELEERLREAVDRDELAVHYQPIVDLTSGEMVGVEALARWRHPERGLVPPDVFVPLAEETGLIVALGREVLRTACRDAAAWAAGGHPIRVSVNLSVRQLAAPQIIEDVEAALRDAGLAADRLTLEITESVLLADTSTTIERLRHLKSLGVRLSIDDFGTGYSALSYLRTFPLDELKIDRAFIGAMGDDPRVANLVAAIVQIGAALGLETVAEGVEHEAELDLLRSYRCERAQGFLFSRPVSARALAQFLAGARASFGVPLVETA